MADIKVEVIKDSVSPKGDRITTYVLEYPRFIHSEFMTHRLFSRNAASSRAIPIDKMIELVEAYPATPLYWGLNKSGMQANEEHKETSVCSAVWDSCKQIAVLSARSLKEMQLHKQIVNRVLEPFQMIKVIVTATEYDNFFWLRCHKDAQPEIKILADKMYQAREESEPRLLQEGEWHLPFIESYKDFNGELFYALKGKDIEGLDLEPISLEQAKKYSAACCAAVSYRTEEMTIEKAERIYSQLIESVPCHASPVEHQATPIRAVQHLTLMWDSGITHQDTDGNYWSGNFKGWIQNRQLIPNNSCNNFEQQ